MHTAIFQDTVMTALVVDDDPFSQQLLCEMLVQDGLFEVHCASDGHHALRTLTDMASPPDLLICDVYMPNMDGIEFLRELGRHCIPIHYGAEELAEDLRTVEVLARR